MRWPEQSQKTAVHAAAGAERQNIREVSALKIRIRFRKYGVMKFVGHLDIMRYFQKCMRRAGIDIAYSQGFSPHQLMSFAAPLGVGITSDGEYLDIEVNAAKSSEESLRALNEVMVEGMEAVSYRRLKDTDKKAMSAVAAAAYQVSLKEGYEAPDADYEAAIEAFYHKPEEILITKQTKKSEKILDLKKLVYDFRVQIEQHSPVFYLKLSAGSVDNVKPEIVLSAFYRFLGESFDPLSVQIHRLDVYGETDGGFFSLGDAGEEITAINNE
ncbi:MAG: DUF2344 domain-containing protein [Eubacterium sp.]|nr:DUF2344 domain-containing protein [Eubacterium sp.]